MTNPTSRRSFLAGLAAVTGSALLAACSAPPAPTAAPAKPAEASKPAEAAKPADTAKPAAAAEPTKPAAAAAGGTTAPAAAKPATSAEKIALAWWSHGAEEENKKKMLNLLVSKYQEKNPNTTVTITWNNYPGLGQALQAAFTADSGYPDIFFAGAGQRAWITAGWIAELSNGINWNNLAPWGKLSGTFPGTDGKPGVYFFPEYATTGEIHINEGMFKDFGIAIPASLQYSVNDFREVIKTITGKGVAAYASANGDRDYPGMAMANYMMLSRFGADDLVKLWKGEIQMSDPRVLEVLTAFEEQVKLKAFPSTFASMTLSESHNFFHTQKKAAMFPLQSFYTARAFVPPDKGGQPKDFQLGFINYPSWPDGPGNKQKFLDPGGSQTVAAKSKNRDQAIAVLNGYTDPDWATEWVGTTGNPTAVKIDSAKVKPDPEHPDYWTKYYKAQDGITHVANTGVGTIAKPAHNEAWTATVSQGMAGGLISAKDAVTKLIDAWKKA
jgi:ABC-type glycerol-3-phosphate transport system substrate-binding protein